MTQRAAGLPDQARLAMRLSPERIAAVLSVVVIALGALLVLRPADRPAASTPPGASAPVGAVGSPTAAPTPEPTAGGSTVPTPTPTAAAWASDARVLLTTESRLVTSRDRLDKLVREKSPPTNELARDLRSMNTTLTAAIALIDSVEADGAPPDIVADLREMHEAALDVSLTTLQASLQNARAYRAGAREVIAALAGLEALMTQTAGSAGIPGPSFEPSASPS